VRIGPFLKREQADVAVERARALSHVDAIIVSEYVGAPASPPDAASRSTAPAG
jgi:hypothetical protein